jgi:hypothetical protein
VSESKLFQQTHFSSVAGQWLKQNGMRSAAFNRREVLYHARTIAVMIGLEKPDRIVHIDDVMAVLIELGIKPDRLGNAAGSVFTTGDWEPVGWRASNRISAHRHKSQTWRLKDGRNLETIGELFPRDKPTRGKTRPKKRRAPEGNLPLEFPA